MTRLLLTVLTVLWLVLAVPVAAGSFGSIVGQVFLDTDGDSVRGAQDPPLAGVVVQLRGRGVERDSPVDADGVYRFDDVAADSYSLSVLLPEGYALQGPTVRPQEVHRATVETGPEFAVVSIARAPASSELASEPTSATEAVGAQPTEPDRSTIADDPTAAPNASSVAVDDNVGSTGAPPSDAQVTPSNSSPRLDPTPVESPVLTAEDGNSQGAVAQAGNTDAAESGPVTTVDEVGSPKPVAQPVALDPNTERALEVASARSGFPTVELGPPPDGGPPPSVPSDYQPLRLDPTLFAPSSSPLRLSEVVQDSTTLWLGVPFRSQLDETAYAQVNCGPASLSMVLGAFGVDVPTADIRAYSNYLSGSSDPRIGTSLDALARIGASVGLQPLGLHENGEYRRWTLDMVRDHLLRGQPVVTLVKYRTLPGHQQSGSEFDHYIVIGGFYRGDFVYNDAALPAGQGHRLLLSPENLERAWEASGMPRHGVAFGGGAGDLHFELPLEAAIALSTSSAPAAVAAAADPAPALQHRGQVRPSVAPDVIVSSSPPPRSAEPVVVAGASPGRAAVASTSPTATVRRESRRASTRIYESPALPTVETAVANLPNAGNAEPEEKDASGPGRVSVPTQPVWSFSLPVLPATLLVLAWATFGLGLWNEARIKRTVRQYAVS